MFQFLWRSTSSTILSAKIVSVCHFLCRESSRFPRQSFFLLSSLWAVCFFSLSYWAIIFVTFPQAEASLPFRSNPRVDYCMWLSCFKIYESPRKLIQLSARSVTWRIDPSCQTNLSAYYLNTAIPILPGKKIRVNTSCGNQ